MKTIDFQSLDEVFECYGRGNLIPIDNIQQLIFYTKHGCQPRFVYENELKPGRITGWFLRSETNHVYKKWMDNRPNKEN
ncbi:MAG: hypothetical protein LUG91_00200 [Ruminococcus sp.]|nr:hypothetical protein [Ruminococcus sp.]